MRRLHGWLLRAATLSYVLLFCHAGCGETDVPAIQHSESQLGDPKDSGSASARKNTCFMAMMYLVAGDTFTYLSGGYETITTNGGSQSTGWRPEIEGRAKCRTTFNGNNGRASLLWNDLVVDECQISSAFLSSDQVKVLAYQDPDGTRVEFHLYAQPQCGDFPEDVSTRAEIEALER